MKAQAINNWWTTFLNIVVLGITVAILSACGGGGSGTTTTSGTTPGLTSGEIEGFGSIVVNGVKFEVEGAEVETEHGVTTTITSATQKDHLHEGMHVEVEVEFNDDNQTGNATRVLINDEVEGEVTFASAPGGDTRTFTVLGQNIIAIAGNTQVHDENLTPPGPATIDDISVTDLIEVHGLPDGNGNIQASFIKIEDPSDLSDDNLDELTGTIDTGTLIENDSFEVNGQVVLYTNSVVDAPPLQEGMLVEVKGTLNGSNELVASLVHVEDGLGDNLAKVEVEGLVRDLTASTFTLNGQQVDFSNATYFGGVEADLVNGLKVEAEGPIVNGVLNATKIKFKDSFRYEGMVTDNTTELTISVPAPAVGTLTVLIEPSMTDVDGSVNYANPVKVRARIASGSTLVATRVDSGGNTDRQIFEAPVVDFNEAADSVEMLDDGSQTGVGLIEVDTSAIDPSPTSDFEIEGTPVPKATFYSNLNVNDRVKARHRDGSWDQIEIELED